MDGRPLTASPVAISTVTSSVRSSMPLQDPDGVMTIRSPTRALILPPVPLVSPLS